VISNWLVVLSVIDGGTALTSCASEWLIVVSDLIVVSEWLIVARLVVVPDWLAVVSELLVMISEWVVVSEWQVVISEWVVLILVDWFCHLSNWWYCIIYEYFWNSNPRSYFIGLYSIQRKHVVLCLDNRSSQTCIKRSSLGPRKSGLIRQVTS